VTAIASYTCGSALLGLAKCAGAMADEQAINTSKKLRNAKFTVTTIDKAGKH